jgi:6-phosphogluconolactonase
MTKPTARIIDYETRGEVFVVADAVQLARTAAAFVDSVTRAAAERRGVATVALSGGSTPKQMGQELISEVYRESVPWGSLRIFWGDERWVSLDDPESNAGEAKRGWLDALVLHDDQVHPFEFGDDPGESASRYEALIRELVPGEPIPQFDLILLGMGGDGHTASLFPGTSALAVTDRLVVANPVPQMDTVRLTFTAPLINAARNVAFLVAGAGKADRLHEVLDGTIQPAELPSQLVRPENGKLIWLVDEAAAEKLDRNSR